MRDDESIGARISAARKMRGLTQQELAAAINVSPSLVKKIEGGHRAATNGTVARVARVLRIPPTQLTGQPYETEAGGPARTTIEALRGELLAYGLPTGDDPPPHDDLARRTQLAADLRHEGAYGRLGLLLPDLLRDLRTAADVAETTADRELVAAWTSRVWDVTAIYAHTLGYPDVAAASAARMREAALDSGDPLRVAIGDTLRAAYLTRAARLPEAVIVADRALDALPPPRGPAAWSTLGCLHLQAALNFARLGDADRTWEHHAEAEAAADRLGSDRDDYDRAFGPTNTAIWSVGLAVELLDDRRAVDHATLTLPADFPAARAGTYWIDVARGQLYAGRRDESLHALLTARDVAPQHVRYSPMVRETLYTLARTERRSSDTLRGLAAWVGLQD